MKNIIFLPLALILASTTFGTNNTADVQPDHAVALLNSIQDTVKHLILPPAQRVQCSPEQAVAVKEQLQSIKSCCVCLDGMPLKDLLTELPIKEWFARAKTAMQGNRGSLIKLINDQPENLFNNKSTAVKLLRACLESVGDPAFQQLLVQHIKSIHRHLLAVAEKHVHDLANKINVDSHVANKTLAQLKTIEPHVERLVKISCGLAHNHTVPFYNNLASELAADEKTQFPKKRGIACSFKPMATYALVKNFYDEAIKPWWVSAKELPDEAVDLDTICLKSDFFMALCDELITICDTKIQSN